MQGCRFAVGAGAFELEVVEVGLNDVFVLAVCDDEFLALFEKFVESLRVVDQHVARAAAEEELDGGIFGGVSLEQLVDVAVGGTEHKAVVGGTCPGCYQAFLFEQFHRRCLRLGVGHIDERGHAAGHCSAALGGYVGLFGQPRLAEMHVSVDYARQEIEAGGIYGCEM